MSRVLIVEDEFFVAVDLEELVQRQVPGAEVVICSSVAEAEGEIGPSLQFALLDIDVTDGQTFSIARRLREAGVPFAFVSGSRSGDVPAGFRTAPFVPKPFTPEAIRRTCAWALNLRRTA